METNKLRVQQTIKFLKWTKKYSGWWILICESSNEHMSPEMMKMLVKRLAEEEFYEMIFVLLEVHKNAEFMVSVKESILKDLLILEWKMGNKDKFIKTLVKYLE